MYLTLCVQWRKQTEIFQLNTGNANAYEHCCTINVFIMLTILHNIKHKTKLLKTQ